MGQSTSSLSRRARRASDPSGNAARMREVQRLFDELALALNESDPERVARVWQAPALVLADGLERMMGSLDELRSAFSRARVQYRDRGIESTRAEMVRIDWPTQEIALVEVHWPHLDHEGREIGGERSTFTLRREDGALKIRAVVVHGEDVGQAPTA